MPQYPARCEPVEERGKGLRVRLVVGYFQFFLPILPTVSFFLYIF